MRHNKLKRRKARKLKAHLKPKNIPIIFSFNVGYLPETIDTDYVEVTDAKLIENE